MIVVSRCEARLEPEQYLTRCGCRRVCRHLYWHTRHTCIQNLRYLNLWYHTKSKVPVRWVASAQTMDVRSDVDEETENQRAEHFECTWYSCTHTVSAVCTRRALSFWILPVRLATPTWFWGSQTGPTEITLAGGRERTICAYLSPTPDFFAPFYYGQCLCPYSQRCSNTNDGLRVPFLPASQSQYLSLFRSPSFALSLLRSILRWREARKKKFHAGMGGTWQGIA